MACMSPADSRSESQIRTPRTELSFLDFPPEIRNSIYRNLLCSDGLIGPNRHSNPKLYGNIVRTNRLIYEEASSIVYGDNYFVIRARDDEGKPHVDFLGQQNLEYNQERALCEFLQKIRSLQIIIEIQGQHDVRNVKNAVKLICNSISQSPCGLRSLYISIDARARYGEDVFLAASSAGVLQLFTRLRNVEHIDLSGIFPRFARIYNDDMSTVPSADSLPKLYNGLKLIVGGFGCCRNELGAAKSAMEVRDAEAFKQARRRTIEGVRDYMNTAWDSLFTKDC